MLALTSSIKDKNVEIKIFDQNKNSDEGIYKMVLERLSEYDFPIIANVPLGHTQDKLTLPIGANIAFDTERLQTIEVKEPVVRSRTR